MKKTTLMAGFVLVFIGYGFFVSFKAHSQDEKAEIPASIYEMYKFEFEGIRRHEGWDVSKFETPLKEPTEIQKEIDGLKVLIKVCKTRQLPIMEVETYMIEDGRLRILKEECELRSVSTYSINGIEFAKSGTFVPVSFSDGVKWTYGKMNNWIYCDEDGNGTFEMRYEYVYHVVEKRLKVPEWVKKKAVESAKPQK